MTELTGLIGGVLSREELLSRIVRPDRPLLRDYVSLEEQVQPNGIDLTLAKVERFAGSGKIAMEGSGRELPKLEEVHPDERGWFHLEAGPWHITYNEVVALPDDLMALGRPRSSLGRSGVAIHTAVWDAGYEGRSTSLLQVVNPSGFSVQRNARVMQLVFVTLNARTAAGYSGQYQGENI
ncbi:MAG TPA: deoxyuridine 5'-triphosphate nucleotidohydrolase [Thermomicrobiales bacterium]|nr:deoxyuridine 5'-triphosphate nucleotidohydrolase [Thermomicrobiales bacterium]